MEIEEERKAIEKLHENMETGRIPVIVIGSGVSAGAGAPSMGDIHKYLLEKLKNVTTPDAEVIKDLLRALTDPKEVESPRSVQVRLYRLLQNSADNKIIKVWDEFGTHLIALKIRNAALGQNAETPDIKRTLFELRPSGGHRKAAELAVNGQAILVSLNFDGMTRSAAETYANSVNKSRDDRSTARIISTPEEILNFHTQNDEDLPMDKDGKTRPWQAVPIIKFRGDVFHAKCDNGRCPEYNESTPIYNLAKIEKKASQEEDSEKKAIKMLACPVCEKKRSLSISFPGVFDKEQDIDKAFSAFHEIYGCSIAGLIFMGFSGRWDEALVDYLIGRAREEALNVPVFILDMVGKAPAITDACRKVEIEPVVKQITFTEADITDKEVSEIFQFQTRTYIPATDSTPIIFPTIADNLLVKAPSLEKIAENIDAKANPSTKPEHKLQIECPENKRTLVYQFDDEYHGDPKTLIGNAIRFAQFDKLGSCNQLGIKGYLIGEKKPTEHNRQRHSMAAAMVARLWHEALLPQARKIGNWSCTEEARMALELVVLFHDGRHLPFSHMMEEVFADLNWGYKSLPIAPNIPVPYPQGVFPELQELKEKLNGKVMGTDVVKILKNAEALQIGRSGVPWLEAIVDSALDADKIEYIFHDTRLTGQNVRLADWSIWFQSFLSNQVLTPEGLIRLRSQSAVAFFDLLQERQHLYRRLYLAPELRAMECMARYIVTTWLEWTIPEKISKEIANINQALNDSTISTERRNDLAKRKDNLRGLKAELASDELWLLFKENNEHTALGKMVEKLEDTSAVGLDKNAIDWVKVLNGAINEVATASKGGTSPSLHYAQSKYARMNPIGPLYVHKKHMKTIRLLVRRWRTNYPLMALIDVATFPGFLATPSNRKAQIVGEKMPVAEQYLVPGEHPGQWGRKHNATVPLHRCDFSSFEHPVLQLVIFDPFGHSSGGSDFVYEMLRRELQRENIDVSESPEKVAHAK